MHWLIDKTIVFLISELDIHFDMDRKEFFKTSCHICLSGMAIAIPALTACSPASYSVFKTVPVNNLIEVPLPLFEKNNLQFVRPKGWQYDIAVHRTEDGSYSALLMQCTHMDNQIKPSQGGYTCNLHGSRFASDGNVVKGPAEKRLKNYSTSINNNTLIIKI